MRLSGFRLFRIAGIDVVVDYSWFIIFFLVIYTMSEGDPQQGNQQYTRYQYLIMGAAAALLFFISILVHELAHCFVAVKHGVQVTTVRLLIFGGLQTNTEPQNGRQEFLIALAGPATSMIIGFFFLAIYSYFMVVGVVPQTAISFSSMPPVPKIAFLLAGVNISLAIFNLIPGFPLDGGRILRAFLWDHWNDIARATKVVSQLGSAFAVFLIILGALQFLVAQNLLFGLWILFIGLFMKLSAVGSYQSVIMKRALSGVQVRQVMTENIVKVDWLLSLEELVQNYIYRHQFTYFPVFNRDEFIGMVSLDGVKSVSKDLWGFKQVRDIMTPLEFVPCLKPGDDVSDALSVMVSGDLGRMPVVENGQLMGMVSRHDIMNFFKIKSDLGAA